MRIRSYTKQNAKAKIRLFGNKDNPLEKDVREEKGMTFD